MVCLRALNIKDGRQSASAGLVPAAVLGILAGRDFRRNGMLMTASGFPFSATLVAQPRDYPEWHKGRSRYGIWMVPIDCPRVLGYVEKVTEQLSDLLHPTRRQPHLTVFVCGFEQPERVHDDDFTADQLARQMAALQRLQPPACSLQIGVPDSFASAAYLRVGDPDGQLSSWREALGEGGREVRFGPYVPHVTLGLYRRQLGAAELRRRLDAVTGTRQVELPVSRLEYADYDSRDMFGRLRCRQVIKLDRRSETRPATDCPGRS